MGHLLQIGTLIFAVIVGWFMLEKRLSIVEVKSAAVEKEQLELQEAQKTQLDALTMLVRQVDRLAIIIEKK